MCPGFLPYFAKAGSYHYVAVQPGCAKPSYGCPATIPAHHPPTAHGFPATAQTQLRENCGCQATTQVRENCGCPAPPTQSSWLSSHHSPKTCPATTKSQLSSHHSPKAQKFPHHGCWPAFFILQDQMESTLKFIEHLAWKHPCRGAFDTPTCNGHHQRHETFPSICPAPSKLPDIYTVMGGVQTSDASGQRKTCICLVSCCLWLTSCNGQAGLHICQQILALPQHSRQIAFCHNSDRLPPCICMMHVCVCLSHLLPGWLLALLALEQIS